MKSGLWAIIPVKPFCSGKSRLAAVLDAPARARLNLALFEHVLGIALTSFGPDHVIVVSADRDALAIASRSGAHGLPEQEPNDLNAALGTACGHAMALGATEIVVLPSDLPFVTAEDLTALTAALSHAPSLAIAPDQAEKGTNALALTPPDPSFFRFGPASFSAHVEAARANNAAITIVRRDGLAFDLDTPDDYRTYAARTPAR